MSNKNARLRLRSLIMPLETLGCSLNEKLAELLNVELLNVDFLNAILRKTELLKKPVENK